MASSSTETFAHGRLATLFGKLPSTLDFVRVNHSTREAIALDEWIQAAMQQLARQGASWPAQRIRFAFRPKACTTSIAGVIAPSCDRAKRKFPIVLSAPLLNQAPRRSFAALLLGAERFFTDAEALLDTIGGAERAQWPALLEALPPPRDAEVDEAAKELEIEVSRSRASEFLDRLLGTAGELDAQQLSGSVANALLELRRHGAERPLVLACAARRTLDVATCGALIQQIFPASVSTPSVFWSTLETSPRALLSVGAPAATLPLWLGDPRARGNQLRQVFPTVAAAQSGAEPTTDSHGPETAELSLEQWLTRMSETVRA